MNGRLVSAAAAGISTGRAEGLDEAWPAVKSPKILTNCAQVSGPTDIGVNGFFFWSRPMGLEILFH